MEALVQERDVEPPVDPVDAKVGEPEEEGGAECHVEPRQGASLLPERSFLDRVVQHAPAADVADEPRQGQQVEHRERLEREGDLFSDLVLEEPRVLLHPVVKDGVVGERRDREVEEEDADVGDPVQRQGLSHDAIPPERRQPGY